MSGSWCEKRPRAWALAAACIALAGGCRKPATESHVNAPHEPSATSTPASGWIDVPPAVRTNLGITFARVESRAVARTIRVPGRFELLPDARREYHTMLPGRVELRVSQFQSVEPGALLYSLESPAWRGIQEQMIQLQTLIAQKQAGAATIGPIMAAHERHHAVLQEAVQVGEERVRRLEGAAATGIVPAEDLSTARAELAMTRAELAEVQEAEAELAARRVEIQSELLGARERFELLLMNASSLVGLSRADLMKPAPESSEHHVPLAPEHQDASDRHPLWRELRVVDVRAAAAGVVESLALTNGAWASEASLVLTTVQPQRLRFRARGLQSDLGRLRSGLPAAIVPPAGGTLASAEPMAGDIELGVAGDPDERTVDIFVTPRRVTGWARPGVSAHLEIVIEGSETPGPAIPTSATIADGLATVFFRRDPRNPDRVMRVIADLGVSDGRWVAVRSGVKVGDEVVLDGVYQLMLATSERVQAGGHFHADGSFHEAGK